MFFGHFSKKLKENKLKESKNSSKFSKKTQAKMPKTSKSGNSDLTFLSAKNTFLLTFFLVLLKNNRLMYFYETPVLLSRSFREFSRRLGKK